MSYDEYMIFILFYFFDFFKNIKYVLLCTVMWLMISHVLIFSDEIILNLES